jgi:hypothetical protein
MLLIDVEEISFWYFFVSKKLWDLRYDKKF